MFTHLAFDQYRYFAVDVALLTVSVETDVPCNLITDWENSPLHIVTIAATCLKPSLG